MRAAGHWEPYEPRGSRTVLGERGGETPPRYSTPALQAGADLCSAGYRARPLHANGMDHARHSHRLSWPGKRARHRERHHERRRHDSRDRHRQDHLPPDRLRRPWRHRAPAEGVQGAAGAPLRGPSTLPGRHGGLLRRPPRRPAAGRARARGAADPGPVREALRQVEQERLPRRGGDRRGGPAADHGQARRARPCR
jgi:hypothetical protein